MSSDAKSMSDVRRVAIILAQLEFDQQNELLSKFSESEVFQVMAEMARLPVISRELVDDVMGTVFDQMREFSRARQGGISVAESILRHRFGPARAAELMERLQDSAPIEAPLSFLNRVEPQQLHGVCATENPQAVAILLAHIDAPLAAIVLGQLDEETRADVTLRIAKLGLLPSTVIQRLANVLDQRLSTFVRSGVSDVALDGVAAAVHILNNSDRASEKDILAKLDRANPEVAEKIRSEMFGWEDAVKLDDRTLQRVLRDVTMPGLAKALKNKDQDVVEKFKANLSSRQVDDLQEEMEALGKIRLSDVEQEESVIVKTIRQLADEGEIDIVRSEEETLV